MSTTTERPLIEAGPKAFTRDDWWVILQAVANEDGRIKRAQARLESAEARDELQAERDHLESLMMRLYETWHRA
jgi:hypothetical protein